MGEVLLLALATSSTLEPNPNPNPDPDPNPNPTLTPTPTHPLVFLHLDKTAGTWFRLMLVHTSARELNLSFDVPCYAADGSFDEESCFRFSPRNRFSSQTLEPSPAIIGGHFQWGDWGDIPDEDVTCVVSLRHPYHRVLSLYNQRFRPLFEGRSLGDLNEDELEWLFGNGLGLRLRDGAYTVVDEGLSDAACKMLCGRNEHRGEVVPEPCFYPDRCDVRPEPFRNSTACSYSTLRRRLRRCTLILQERWDESQEVLAARLPYLYREPDLKANMNGRDDADLSLKAKAAIAAHNRCDLFLHDIATLKFDDDLAEARSQGEAQAEASASASAQAWAEED